MKDNGHILIIFVLLIFISLVIFVIQTTGFDAKTYIPMMFRNMIEGFKNLHLGSSIKELFNGI